MVEIIAAKRGAEINLAAYRSFGSSSKARRKVLHISVSTASEPDKDEFLSFVQRMLSEKGLRHIAVSWETSFSLPDNVYIASIDNPA